MGMLSQARQHVISTLAKSNGRDSQYVAALALALTGDSAAQRRSPMIWQSVSRMTPWCASTIFRLCTRNSLSILPATERRPLKRWPPLRPTTRRSGQRTFWTNLYPIYIRGEAYLAAHQGAQAAAEFQKIVDWRGVVASEPIGALAHLGLARAYALAGDTTKSRAAYDDVLQAVERRRCGHPDLQQAKAEYSRLQ